MTLLHDQPKEKEENFMEGSKANLPPCMRVHALPACTVIMHLVILFNLLANKKERKVPVICWEKNRETMCGEGKVAG
jgi:hypothetical protein